MSLKQNRKAIADFLQAAKPEWNMYATVPARPTYPAVIVVPSNDTSYKREGMVRNGVWLIDVIVQLAFTEMETAQDELDDAVDPMVEGSIWSLLESDATLGGTVMDCTPIEVLNYGQAQAGEAGGAPFIGAHIRLEVREC